MEDTTGSLTFFPAPLPDKRGPSAACLTDANMSSITKASSALLRAAVNACRTAQKKMSVCSLTVEFQIEIMLDRNQFFLFLFLVIIKTTELFEYLTYCSCMYTCKYLLKDENLCLAVIKATDNAALQ